MVRFDYTGPMYCAESRTKNFAVTPDHKMLVRKWSEADRTLEADFNLVNMDKVGWYSGLMCNLNYQGETTSEFYTLPGTDNATRSEQRADRDLAMVDWLHLLGIYLAEGTMIGYDGHHKIQLAASKPREKEFIVDLMKRLELTYCELEDRVTFENKQFYTEFTRLGLLGVKAPEKFVPDFVFKLPSHQIKEFLHGHAMGDGCYQNDVWSHYTSSKKLSNDLHMLVIMSGEWGLVSEREPRTSTMKDGRTVTGKYPEYRVSRYEKENISLERKNEVDVEHYDGEVFCAEVPTYHTLITRRNGRVLVSGNCSSFATSGALEFLELQELKLDLAALQVYVASQFTPISELFIYYGERVIEGTVDQDAGATTLRDACVTVTKTGCSQ
jgi:hypothetical protein